MSAETPQDVRDGKLNGYLEAGAGAIIGFVLAQLVNVAKLGWDWRNRPKLVIETNDKNSVLETGESHTIYGCSVRNIGRRIARGVRVQLVRIEGRRSGHEYRCLLENAYDLSPLRGEKGKLNPGPLVLIPEAAVEIALASKKNLDDGSIHEDIVFPSVSTIPELFEEMVSGFDEYRYTVIAFDDENHHARKALSIR